MLNEFQKKKFTHLFKLLDTNKDQSIDATDLENTVSALAKTRGLDPGAPALADLLGKYRSLHHAMVSKADTNHDGKVSLAEYLAYHQAIVENEAQYKATIVGITALFGQLLDSNGDGKNDVDDYRSFLRAMKLDEAQAAATFKVLDKNSDGLLSKDELEELVHEFYFDATGTAPGNRFFGAL